MRKSLRVDDVRDFGQIFFDQVERFDPEQGFKAAPAILDLPVRSDPHEHVRQGHEHGAHELVAMHEFRGAYFQGSFQDVLFLLELAVCLLDEPHELVQVFGQVAGRDPGPLELALQQAMHAHPRSRSTVMVMVWLCRQQDSPVSLQAISP